MRVVYLLLLTQYKDARIGPTLNLHITIWNRHVHCVFKKLPTLKFAVTLTQTISFNVVLVAL